MRGHVSRDECRCYGAASIGVECFDCCTFEDGMVGEAQIVVRAKEDEFPAFDANAGFLTGFYTSH